jgi:hypothetical protein
MRASTGAFLRIVKRNKTSTPAGPSDGPEARPPRPARAAPPLLVAFLLAVSPLGAADLKPTTAAAYERYVQEVEKQIAQAHAAGRFLYMDSLPPAARDKALSEIKHGEIFVVPVEILGPAGKPSDVPDGMVHHWVGSTFIPRATLEQTMNVLFNYERYKDIYKPEVVGSRLLSRTDGDLKVNLRLQKKTSFVSVTYDCDYDVQFKRLDEHHAFSHTRATRVQQVENAGRPDERLDPAGHDSGYLWGTGTFWEAEEVSDGVIIEWQVISLSRQIPFLLRWVVRPLIAHLAHETVTDMLTNTRAAVEAALKSPDRNGQNPAHAKP